MKTNILIVLDTRRPKPDGTFALLLRIIHGTTSSQISLKKYFHLKDWDIKERKVKSSYKGTESVLRLNNYIQSKKAELSDFINRLDEKKILITLSNAQQIKELFEQKSQSLSFYDYMQKLINNMKAINRIGNARSYENALTALKNFRGKESLSFIQLNYSFLLQFENHHYAKGNKTNGLAVYMRSIRAVYNQAIKDGIVERELYPFSNYTIKTQKTRKRAISIEAISKIKNLEFNSQHPLFHARNYFLFSFFTRGMPFADIARLKVSDIINGRIMYERVKTHKPYNVKIIPETQIILSHYIAEKRKNDYIFPIIKRTTEQDIHKDIKWARSRYNKKLKKLATLCGIEETVTSYVPRHSFATRAKNLGIPVSNLSDMLGHESIKTTEIYMDSLPSDLMDEDHEKIINGI